MGRFLVIGLLILPTSGLFGQRKIDLICGEWIQFGFKPNKDKAIRILTEDCSKKKCEFNRNGNYSEDMFCLKELGKWTFNSDSTKLGFKTTEFMGQKLTDNSAIKSFTTIIIRLTADTLIYGHEGYYGNERVYGHDDWYFVKRKK